ncbi:phage major capsid protein [Gordonia sp. HY442]|uniref:phage major capsid protein n=1 Tax=Gordonia zhenghanii TaxID=2911516 RepID=UPI001F02C182|nr:phage major capsid protein [Gordonia zhenghanii]MCF8605146.1 phage major capsid protein [Gordonia zhenghanii]
MKMSEQRDELLAKAQGLIAQRKDAGEELTDEDRAALADYKAKIDDLNAQIEKAGEDEKLLSAIKKLGSDAPAPTPGDDPKPGDAPKARSLGEHVVKSIGDRLSQAKSDGGRFSVSTPEFKAPATQVVGDWDEGVPLLTQYDRTIVTPKRERPVVADLLGSGAISGNAISYFIEGAMQGGFGNVAEGGAKPQISFDNPTAVVDALKKIAGHIKFTDEFLEDVPFLKSEIDTRLLYQLAMYEERQLLNGDGTGQNLLGLRKRSGIQTETAASEADGADAIFRAMTKIATATDLTADGIVINPLDYQSFRLNKDGNGQYYGGGYFAGQYGNGSLTEQPALWGQRTIVTPAIEQGKVLVGAFKQAATVYRKGGVRVEATNSHVDDFTNNLVTVRAEERVALACRQPLAVVEVSLAAVGG